MRTDHELARLDDLLDQLWAELNLAKSRGDWASYWSIRRSWLATGRLHSLLIHERAEESRAQLSLLPSSAGRVHDRDAG